MKKEYEEITITCTSPSKTFNLAGLQISNIFIPNLRLRRAFRKQIDAVGYSQVNAMGLTAHEGTYLVWLDFTKTGLSVDELEDFIIHEAKLWLDSGKIFGESGNGFQRINVACPRKVLEEALSRIKDAWERRKSL